MRNNQIIAKGDPETMRIVDALLLRLDGVSTRSSSGKPSVPPSPFSPSSSKPNEQKPLSFRTAKVTRGDIAATISATGTIEPEVVVDVSSQVSGPIMKVFVDYNTMVKQNTLVAEIDPTEYKTRLDNEQAGLNQRKGRIGAGCLPN